MDASDAGSRDAAVADATPATDAGMEMDASALDACALGRACNPILIDVFPFIDRRDTTASASDEIDVYACAPATDESGPEVFYRVDLPAPGLLSVSVDDVPGDAVDVDVHLLSEIDGASCLERDNIGFSRIVEARTYFITADSWVDGSGTTLAGPYTLRVDFTETASGACAIMETDLEMVWTECSPTMAGCFEQAGARFLRLPAIGPVVKEAHLVTTDEDFGGGWPTSLRDRIERHYTISEMTSGYAAARTEPWAPAGEGGSEYGQGATGAPVPAIDEAWYINMYWRQRPARGTRMIVRNPANGLAVVASAGYETGPGSNTAIAGVAEEIHLYLGTGHRDDLEVGFAADPNLPLGPIDCR
jgi:hypothetical protein